MKRLFKSAFAVVLLIALAWAGWAQYQIYAQFPSNGSSATTSGTPGTVSAMTSTTVGTPFAIFFADPTNTASISIGPTSAASLYAVAAGTQYIIQCAPSQYGVVELETWYVKSTGASQAYKVTYVKPPTAK